MWFVVESLRLFNARGPRQALATPGPTSVPDLTGVGGTWRMSIGFHGNLGDLTVSIVNGRSEPGLPTPG
jgi:hypothetical protein